MVDSAAACVRGRARARWAPTADEAGTGGTGEDVGGGPATAWRVIRACVVM